MLPSIEAKLIKNTGFKRLVLAAFSRAIKTELDRLTIEGEPTTNAEVKLLDFLRKKMRTGSIQNHQVPTEANAIYVSGILSIFDDTQEDDIAYRGDEQKALEVDWDQSKPILINKIKKSGYLYGLAECVKGDYEPNEAG